MTAGATNVTIASADKDLAQLVTRRVNMLDVFTNERLGPDEASRAPCCLYSTTDEPSMSCNSQVLLTVCLVVKYCPLSIAYYAHVTLWYIRCILLAIYNELRSARGIRRPLRSLRSEKYNTLRM